jgi:hypothetical protein
MKVPLPQDNVRSLLDVLLQLPSLPAAPAGRVLGGGRRRPEQPRSVRLCAELATNGVEPIGLGLGRRVLAVSVAAPLPVEDRAVLEDSNTSLLVLPSDDGRTTFSDAVDSQSSKTYCASVQGLAASARETQVLSSPQTLSGPHSGL